MEVIAIDWKSKHENYLKRAKIQCNQIVLFCVNENNLEVMFCGATEQYVNFECHRIAIQRFKGKTAK